MIQILTEPFAYGFMQNAFAIAALIAVPSALLSCFLVLRGWSLMGDAVSHAVLPGIVLAYVAGLPLILGAFAAGMFCSLTAGFVQDNSRVKQDTVLGVVMSGMFGLGIVMLTQISTDLHLDHVLFGNILGTGAPELWRAGGIGLAVTAALLVTWRDYGLFSFDPVQARVVGLPTRALHYGLLAMLSVMVVAMLSSVGIILSVALLIAPGAIAYLIAPRRLGRMLAVAVMVSLSGAILGVWLSFWIDSATAPTIVLVLTAIFVATFAFRQIQLARA
ncbi:metal ABC transporter permease [Paracoccus sp. TK19116]|uniref:Metal ABC transporter permease n=1 Tax=Paracoccus albicereus TaxID=2922394 RepID=A0ABT1MNL3_9RHOB|nr:metal ABC transporter permease [Paracoccus albicereus]MCQ0969761.1 metal ABC transporter permease [Paracoccus albicereus]